MTIPIANQRQRQTYYGAINYHSCEVHVKAYPKGDGDNTVKFVKYLQQKHPGRRLVLIWDGASYHTKGKMQEYLTQVNAELPADQRPLTCILFAPYAPEQNPTEDVWNKAKTFMREHYYLIHKFADAKRFFMAGVQQKIYQFKRSTAFA